jgi:hypothetical protein
MINNIVFLIVNNVLYFSMQPRIYSAQEKVATGGRVIIRRAWGECKVKSILLRRRCSLKGKIWCLDKCNFIIENQVEQVFTSRDSLLGEPMFKVEYDDAKRRCKGKRNKGTKKKLSATLAKNSSTELTAGLRH